MPHKVCDKCAGSGLTLCGVCNTCSESGRILHRICDTFSESDTGVTTLPRRLWHTSSTSRRKWCNVWYNVYVTRSESQRSAHDAHLYPDAVLT